jgi:hypothetical protein
MALSVTIFGKQNALKMPVGAVIPFAKSAGDLTLTLPSVYVAGDYPFGSGRIFPAGNYKISYVNGALAVASSIVDPVWAVYWRDPGYLTYNGCFISTMDGDFYFTAPPVSTTLYDTQADAEAHYAGAHINVTTTAPGTIRLRFYDLPYDDNSDGDPNPTFTLSPA